MGGPSLLLLRAALDRPELPFLAIREPTSDAVPYRQPADRFDPVFLRHPGGARGIHGVTIRSRVLPELGSLRPHQVTFVTGEPRLGLEIDGVAEPWTFGSAPWPG